jgi:hypothetical protein
VLHAVTEQGAVGQVRERVVESLVLELLLVGLALADVSSVQNDAPNVLIVQQVRPQRRREALGMPEAELGERGCVSPSAPAPPFTRNCSTLSCPLGGRRSSVCALELGRVVAEHALDRGADPESAFTTVTTSDEC